MIELKAELIKKRQEYEASKNRVKSKSDLRPPEKRNKYEGVDGIRSSTKFDDDDEELLKKSRDALEAKARLYKQLERGKLTESDLNSSQRENLMVDFAYKGWNAELQDFEFESSDDDDDFNDEYDEKSTDNNKKIIYTQSEVDEMIKTDEKDADKWIEFEDEFGRLRVRKLADLIKEHREQEELYRELAVSASSVHYDGDAEIRNKGVAFYRFARDESSRKAQLDQLKRLREETLEKRMRALLIKEERRLFVEGRLNRIRAARKKDKSNDNHL